VSILGTMRFPQLDVSASMIANSSRFPEGGLTTTVAQVHDEEGAEETHAAVVELTTTEEPTQHSESYMKFYFKTLRYRSLLCFKLNFVTSSSQAWTMCSPNHLSLDRSLILDHSYLVGNLTHSKFLKQKALEPLKP
jgi:hypothetical protein